MLPIALSIAGREVALRDFGVPLRLGELAPGDGPWEFELGFGKGRFLLARAAQQPQRRFLGVEQVSEYYRRVQRRGSRKQLGNLALLRGEAVYLAAALLPPASAAAVHIYFPDPWPKTRHRRRRLFDPGTIDLVLGLLAPHGELFFATDFVAYGEEVLRLLASYPHVEVSRPLSWPEGPRTNYEAKYVRDGRPILRACARLLAPALAPHPWGEASIANAWLDIQPMLRWRLPERREGAARNCE
jgi:tRNA (guanine-N7-)-methyltransferase